MDLMHNYYLQNYIYPERRETTTVTPDLSVTEEWNRWHCAILVEWDQDFIEKKADPVSEFQEELRVEFYTIRLNQHQQLFLFYSKHGDYRLIASRFYAILKREYQVRFYLAVSNVFDGYEKLPEIVAGLEKMMEGKFYYPEEHILYPGDCYKTVSKEAMDSQLVNEIGVDIQRKDVKALRNHFRILKEKYEKQNRSSLMYVRFIFSNVLQDLYQEDFSTIENLKSEMEAVYSCEGLPEVIGIVEKNVNVFCAFAETDMLKAREKVLRAIDYMKTHIQEELNAESLGKMAELPPGYLLSTIRRETGLNLYHLRHKLQMEKAKKLLTETQLSVEETGVLVGFRGRKEFSIAYQQYYGISDRFA